MSHFESPQGGDDFTTALASVHLSFEFWEAGNTYGLEGCGSELYGFRLAYGWVPG